MKIVEELAVMLNLFRKRTVSLELQEPRTRWGEVDHRSEFMENKATARLKGENASSRNIYKMERLNIPGDQLLMSEPNCQRELHRNSNRSFEPWQKSQRVKQGKGLKSK